MTNIILILGNSNPEILNKRLDRGIKEFYKLKNPYEDEEIVFGINTLIILSGKGAVIKVDNKVYATEADYMYEYVSQKVNKKYILIENLSNNTIENLVNSFNILSKLYKDSLFNRINITICTSSFHLKRTIVLSKILNKDNYTLKYIHTNEIVGEEENRRELRHLDNFMNYYCNNLSSL
jgi:uncharacterized SAM-binding protein YcdF (DUF218 family)